MVRNHRGSDDQKRKTARLPQSKSLLGSHGAGLAVIPTAIARVDRRWRGASGIPTRVVTVSHVGQKVEIGIQSPNRRLPLSPPPDYAQCVGAVLRYADRHRNPPGVGPPGLARDVIQIGIYRPDTHCPVSILPQHIGVVVGPDGQSHRGPPVIRAVSMRHGTAQAWIETPYGDCRVIPPPHETSVAIRS